MPHGRSSGSSSSHSGYNSQARTRLSCRAHAFGTHCVITLLEMPPATCLCVRQGNNYNMPGGTNSSGGRSYHYFNSNGSYHYANDNGSTYHTTTARARRRTLPPLGIPSRTTSTK